MTLIFVILVLTLVIWLIIRARNKSQNKHPSNKLPPAADQRSILSDRVSKIATPSIALPTLNQSTNFSTGYEKIAAAAHPANATQFETELLRAAKPALALVRPLPATFSTNSIRSRVGGLPDLPAGAGWPRSRNVANQHQPLHFLAQIDLAELPWRPELVPERGTLLFFALFDADMSWSGSSEDVNVIFDPASKGQRTAPPDTIGDWQGGYHDYDRSFRLDDEPKRKTLNAWPLKAHVVDTLPGDPQFASGFEYNDLVKIEELEHKFNQIQLAKIYSPERPKQISLVDLGWIVREKDQPDRLGPSCFEQAIKIKRFIELWLRTIYKNLQKSKAWHIQKLAEAEQKDLASDVAKFADDIQREDLAIASCLPLINEVTNTAHLAWPNAAAKHEALRFLKENAKYFSVSLEFGLQTVLDQVIRECSENPDLAASIPANWFHAAKDEHLTCPKKEKEDIYFHQMFGHIRTTQWNADEDSTDICLLQLKSDWGVDLMICDVGEMEFWIKPEDLAKLDFSKVWGTTQGG